MKKVILNAHLFLLIAGLVLTGCRSAKEIIFRPKPEETIKACQKFELTFDMEEITGNPFNPEDIEVTATFCSPGGKEIKINSFFYQDYERSLLNDENESLIPKGQSYWKVRFTPTETGIYSYEVYAKTKLNIYKSRHRKLEVISSDSPGFIRISQKDPRYFEFDCGSPYFAIGHNLCWYSSSKGTYDYDYYFSKMEEAGENYTRIWLSPWAFALEWETLGRYNLTNAWQLDYVLSLAESKGIYIVLCIDSFNTLKTSSPYGRWASSPYNKANGGPCAEPEDFFTRPEAKKYYKKKLQYIISRWGYSPHILAWEMWNEVDFTDSYSPQNTRDWHREIIQYLNKLDPHRHLITTSYFEPLRDPETWQLQGIDFTQSRAYGSNDIALTIHELCNKMNKLYTKPHLISEFAITHRDKDSDCDPKGHYLHDGIWSAVFSLASGTAMSWWWDTHIDKNNLYYHFKALAEFVRDIKWTKENYESIQVKCYETQNPLKSIPVMAYSLINNARTKMLLWIQNKSDRDDFTAEPTGLKDGNYLIEWWDTYQGIILKKEEKKCAEGRLIISIPSFDRDIAAKISCLPLSLSAID